MQLDSTISAIVTGGASGLGLATAKTLAATGVRVTIFDLNQQAGEAAAAAIGGQFAAVDITSEASVLAGFATAREAHGQERILVNCAGGGRSVKAVSRDRATGAIKRHSTEDFERSIQLNLIGTFRCITIAAAGMCTLDPDSEGERGVITNTASIAAIEGQIGQAAYSASKAGIVGMTLTLARDFASEGVRINTIMPGLFGTPPMLALPQAALDALASTVPFPKRLGRPEEFASLVLELTRNSYFNGQAIRLDGSIRLAPR